MNKLSFLIVDDVFVNRLLLSEIIKRSGAKYQFANNGKEALEKVIDNDFSMVLMDIEMPIMNGLESTKKIRNLENKKKAKVPIIALSAHNINDMSEEFDEAGFSDFLPKPYSAQKVKEIINKFCLKQSEI